MRKTLSVIAVAVLGAAAASASAQRYYDPAWPDRTTEWRGGQECWNPRAGHFEAVRPGEFQGDLDYNNCRGAAYGGAYYVDRGDRYVGRVYRDDRYGREECWNPRAGHFEEVRRGEYQGDLDYRRCRIARY